MKIIPGLTLAAMLSTGVVSRLSADTPPPIPVLPPPGTTSTTPAPAPAPQAPPAMPPANPVIAIPPPPITNKPAAKPAATTKKKSTATKVAATSKKTTSGKKDKTSSKTPEAAKPSAPLIPNEPAVAKQNNVIVRGQASINSEIVTKLKDGETVTVLELVTIKHPKTDEPPSWAKIALPARVHAWVNTSFLDADQKVKPSKLKVRSGAGENYSMIGLLHKGDPVKVISTKGDWTEIETPAGSYAFVASHLLAYKEPEPTPVVPPVLPTTPVAVEPTTPPIAPPPTTNPALTQNAPPPVVPIIRPVVPVPQLPPDDDEPPPKRIIERDGIVGGTVSIQAPTHFELQSLDTGKVIDYLYSTSTNLVLKRYRGLTVHVTGEEGLDERWPNTPVITIQKIQVVQ